MPPPRIQSNTCQVTTVSVRLKLFKSWSQHDFLFLGIGISYVKDICVAMLATRIARL